MRAEKAVVESRRSEPVVDRRSEFCQRRKDVPNLPEKDGCHEVKDCMNRELDMWTEW